VHETLISPFNVGDNVVNVLKQSQVLENIDVKGMFPPSFPLGWKLSRRSVMMCR